jgi:hypothetical protein
VSTTASIAREAVRWIGRRMAGESWLMLSSPENASQAPANPASARGNGRPRTAVSCSPTSAHCSGVMWMPTTIATTMFVISDAIAM